MFSLISIPTYAYTPACTNAHAHTGKHTHTYPTITNNDDYAAWFKHNSS